MDKNLSKVICAFVLGLAFAAATSAQRSKPTPKPTPPITTIEATTKEGKPVILKSDGTWTYGDPPLLPPVVSNHSIDVQAAIIFQSGEVVPVARTNFYLLGRSLEDILVTDANRQILIDDLRARAPQPNDYLTEQVVKEYQGMKLSGFIKNSMSSLSRRYMDTTGPMIQAVVKFTATTDFQGNVTFKDVPPGEYYLFGWTEIRKNFVSWHVKVTVDKADQKIILDSNNRLP